MTRRYYAPELSPAGGLIQLSDEEAGHAARVMRAQIGDSIQLFDGCGNQADATVHSIDKRHCAVFASPPQAIDREPACRSHFGIAFPKPERAKEMIERLTELGVHRITPITCDRTQRPPTDALLTKMRRIVIESCKQCERNHLMAIDRPVNFDEFVCRPLEGARWIAHPDGQLLDSVTANRAPDQQATVLIGPEGGFTDDEVNLAKDMGFAPVGLGKRIYRIETAACAIAAFLSE
ncbi:MAG: 16S rRNA (uracil(1498)-N(3))-methyltransferase [Planctomycetales bacterium]|nr:16S rRNA (uracil(1498)-N(3))-methyltransferase [Planctomycetales bacterium]